MPARREWTYYTINVAGSPLPTTYVRTWRGIAQRLDRQAWEWLDIDAIDFSEQLENGEHSIDGTTRTAIERTLKRILPA